MSTSRTLTPSEARKNLYQLIDDVSESHEPIVITGPRHNAVMIGEEDWRSVQETLYLLNIPGMRESILQGMGEPAEELTDMGDLNWSNTR